MGEKIVRILIYANPPEVQWRLVYRRRLRMRTCPRSRSPRKESTIIHVIIVQMYGSVLGRVSVCYL